ncbi:uncharacterized protein DS421_15g502500 [Arachis hypogaea]|nr:uncharacterized protein DS421_15g502500 [Arachis hypogaea]
MAPAGITATAPSKDQRRYESERKSSELREQRSRATAAHASPPSSSPRHRVLTMPPSSMGEAKEREYTKRESAQKEREPVLPPPPSTAVVACSVAAPRGGWPSLCRRKPPLKLLSWVELWFVHAEFSSRACNMKLPRRQRSRRHSVFSDIRRFTMAERAPREKGFVDNVWVLGSVC